jgi:hypothetical protein
MDALGPGDLTMLAEQRRAFGSAVVRNGSLTAIDLSTISGPERRASLQVSTALSH